MTRYSDAAMILMSEGVVLDAVAARLGVTRQAISWHLAGRSAANPAGLRAALIALTNRDVAVRVLAAIEAARDDARAS